MNPVLILFVAGLWSAPEVKEVRPELCQPWETEYQGDDAKGKQVLGLWQFNPGSETKDASGNGHDLTLQGATISKEGRFGGGLESFPGFPVEDKRHQATTKNSPRLTPKGAFSLELWIKPKPQLDAKYPDAFLLDKKYASHDDYQLILGGADRNGVRMLRASLGFGDDSSHWYSRPLKLETGKWYHVAFTYDGAGTGSFFVNGVPEGSQKIGGRKAVTPGKNALSIGDRVGSYYHGFPGVIDQVRISNGVLEFRKVLFELASQRKVFRRMEGQAVIPLRVTNLQRLPIKAAKVEIAASGLPPQEYTVESLAGGDSTLVRYALDTRLRPGKYTLVATLRTAGPQGIESGDRAEVEIAARRPIEFPVIMWGVANEDLQDLTRLLRIGFNHVVALGADYGLVWEAGKAVVPGKPEHVLGNKATLDRALSNNVNILFSLSPGSWLRKDEKYLRVNRKGQTNPQRGDICGLFPEIGKFCRNVGASVAAEYGEFPAFRGALCHTEVRDSASPCFHEHDREAYRKATGRDIPPEVSAAHGVNYQKIQGFPASRIVPDDHPLLAYYRWYWKKGDGWNDLNSALDQGLKSGARRDLWTFHDPAVRVARVFGSGGSVNFLSHWTYSYPDPIRIGLATDELFATAAGAGAKQQVMKMTQIIWYRGQTAPMRKPGGSAPPFQADWEREQPEAPFITIAPDHLSEAFWTKIARPIKGIMYHGWGSLVNVEPPSGYRYTNPQTQHQLARLTAEVTRPLGPTLLAVPGVQSDVAFLESFASEMFAQRGTYGWGRGWLGDAYHVALYAHLQPEIVLDETILRDGLDHFRVLILCDCDVLTQSVFDRIKAFQAKGGLIVGDERLAPAIKPDILIPVYQRTGQADLDRASLLQLAAGLRKSLDAKYARYLDVASPDIMPYLRRHAETDYVFLANDRREFGQYVGQHGVVMENGQHSRGVVSLARPAASVYDLVEGRPVSSRVAGQQLQADIELGPGGGKLLMVTPKAIDRVTVAGPATAERGRAVAFQISVLDRDGQPIKAVVPVEVNIRDAAGRTGEFSGYYAAIDGQLKVTLDIASNDAPGVWQIEVRELASRQKASQFLRVIGPSPWPPEKKPVPKELANPVQPLG